VFGDVLGHVRQPVEEQAPDAGGVGVLADKHVLQIRVAGCLVDGGVHPHVEAQQRARVIAGVELRDLVGRDSASFTRVSSGALLAARAATKWLQLSPDLLDVGQIGDVDRRREACRGVDRR
jgi:hypothetical protein